MQLGTIFIIAVQAALVVAQKSPTVKWTLHASCYEDAALREKILSSMATVKSRSARATKISGYINRSLGKAIDVICPKEKRDAVVARFKLHAALEGPIGKPANDNQITGVYATSREWLEVMSQPDSYKNFVIYCAPNVEVAEDALQGNTLYYIRTESKKGFYGNPLTVMYEDQQAGRMRPPERQILAATTRYEAGVDKELLLNPNTDLAKVPEGITFNKVFLDTTRQRYGGYDVVTKDFVEQLAGPDGPKLVKDRLADYISKNPDLSAQQKKNMENWTPVDLLVNAIEVILHHETFHLTAFGRLDDDEGVAYGWKNNLEEQNPNNPEYYAIIGLLVDLYEIYKVRVDKDGNLSRI